MARHDGKPVAISIHALREEGDPPPWAKPAQKSAFLSTPSARRATQPVGTCHPGRTISIHALREEGDPTPSTRSAYRRISIHALREEGDPLPMWSICTAFYFYPRPPRGGRLQTSKHKHIFLRISIHALREEGDGTAQIHVVDIDKFLSTPSARRAT